jgi:cell division protein FtsL
MEFDSLNKPIDVKTILGFWREGLLVALVILLIVSAFQTKSLLQKSNEQEIATQKTQNEVSRLKIEVETLIAQSAEDTKAEIEKRLAEEQGKIVALQGQLSSESQKRIALEGKLTAETGLSSTRLSGLEASLKNKYDLTSIISTWRKRTARVACQFGIGSGSGSGVLTYYDAGDGPRYGVLTNKHVINYNGRSANSCTVTFPDSAFTFTATREAGQIQTSTKGYDFGRLLIPEINAYVISNAAKDTDFCKVNPVAGDELVILGYPKIGSGSDITATEGIISGYDGDYYITSAKVEQGNSGGATILLKNNCMLGIPTFVELGNLEALARILKISVIFD